MGRYRTAQLLSESFTARSSGASPGRVVSARIRGSQPIYVLLQPQSDGSLPREIALEPLTPAEARELALRLIGQDDAAAVMLADTIVRESRGSPYFVYELVEFLREGGDLADGSTASSDPASTMCSRSGSAGSRLRRINCWKSWLSRASRCARPWRARPLACARGIPV